MPDERARAIVMLQGPRDGSREPDGLPVSFIRKLLKKGKTDKLELDAKTSHSRVNDDKYRSIAGAIDMDEDIHTGTAG